MKLTRSEHMLFALLKGSLNDSVAGQELFVNASAAEWNQCYTLASKQGVLALAWEGVQSLPLELQCPKEQKIKWALSVVKYESRHRRFCDTVQELQQFYREHGIVAVQIKGVGLSAGYNYPHHREGGDIDIFTLSADTSKISHREATSLADKLMEQMGNPVGMHGYKHSNFLFRGIPVENHKCFLNVLINRKFLGNMNELLHRVLEPREVLLYNGEYRILVPSPLFNTLFISCHAFQHYGSGIALHHLYDWATLLTNHGLHLPDEINNVKFLRAVAAMTHLCNVHMGTDINLDTFPDGYQEMADEMLEEMLHPVYSNEVHYTGSVKTFVYKTRKVLRSAKLANDVFGGSIFGRILESFISHVMHSRPVASE